MSIISEGDALKVIDDALTGLDEKAQRRVLKWASSKYLGDSTDPKPNESTGDTGKRARRIVKETKPQKKSSGGKKAKLIIKQIKDLNLHPADKASAADFMNEKQPTNQKQKCVAAIYYLKSVLEMEKVGVSHVHTVFKNVGWPTPIDLFNTLHQAGTEGWLDTANAEDLKVTSSGENLIEHNLPKRKKKAS